VTDRRVAEDLDRVDPLRDFRDRFLGTAGTSGTGDDADRLIYLDGNSLGRLPVDTLTRLTQVVHREWGEGLVRSWDHWIEWPVTVGDALGAGLLGAAAGQLAISDSTTVNLYKLAAAALELRPDRRTIVTDARNFPSDTYVFEGLAAARGLRLVELDVDPVQGCSASDIANAVDDDTAFVSLSHVDYRSGALADLAAITAASHAAGALVLWDLSHSVGAVPISLDAAGADFAVGSTYKYLNAGPGSPAFLYVRSDLQARVRQPIWGWFGQHEQFEMTPRYEPVAGIERFLVGTPNILGIALVDAGVRLVAEAGIDRVRAKSIALTSYLVELADAWLTPLGFDLATPRDAARRGSHVSLSHRHAYRISQQLIERARVIPDFRRPDLLRLGLSPLTTSFVDVYDGMDRLRDLVASGRHLKADVTARRVT
jgi:kynureninase